MDDKDLTTRVMRLLWEEKSLEFLHIVGSLHKVVDVRDTLQTEWDVVLFLLQNVSYWKAGIVHIKLSGDR